jgi:hypothetical protein
MIKVTIAFKPSDPPLEHGNNYVATHTEDGQWSTEPNYPVMEQLETKLGNEQDILFTGPPSKGGPPSLVGKNELQILATIELYFPQWDDVIDDFTVEHDRESSFNPDVIY